MDFSTLFSDGPSLYIIGGVLLALVLGIVLVVMNKKSGGTVAPLVPTPVPSEATVSQSLTHEAETLPSTDIAEVSPAVIPPVTAPEAAKAEIPPLSSWKPSQDAAPIQAEEGTNDTAQSVPPQSEEKASM